MAQRNLLEFPEELLLSIVVLISTPGDLVCFMMACKSLSIFCADERIWKKLLETHFPHLPATEKYNRYSFIEAYKEEYKGLTPPAKRMYSIAKAGDFGSLEQLNIPGTSGFFITRRIMRSHDSKGIYLTEWAHRGRSQKILDLLFQEMTAKSGSESEKVYWAVACKQPAAVYENAADLTYRHFPMKTPFYIAVATGQLNFVNLFLSKGYELEEDELGCLNKAIENRDIPMITNFLDRGWRLDREYPLNGGMPLVHAIRTGDITIIQLLLDRGAPFRGDAFKCAVFESDDQTFEFLKTARPNLEGPYDYDAAMEHAIHTLNIIAVNRLLSYAQPADISRHLLDVLIQQNFHLHLKMSEQEKNLNRLIILHLFVVRGINLNNFNAHTIISRFRAEHIQPNIEDVFHSFLEDYKRNRGISSFFYFTINNIKPHLDILLEIFKTHPQRMEIYNFIITQLAYPSENTKTNLSTAYHHPIFADCEKPSFQFPFPIFPSFETSCQKRIAEIAEKQESFMRSLDTPSRFNAS